MQPYYFKREELPETLQARFQNECQEEGEALRDWADRILTLAAKAYKDLPETWIRRHAIIRFCMGCLDREAGQHACIQQPKTFDEAMDKIEWFRCITKTTKSKSVPSKSSKSDSSINAYQCKIYGYYGTNSSEDEDDEEEDYVPLRKVNTRWKNSPPSILKKDTGAFAKSQPSPNENPQSGAQETAIAEMAKQMSKMSTEISSLGSKFSDLNSGLTKMLQEISHSRSLSPRRYNCFTCGSHLHFAKDCPSKLSRSPEEKTLRFQDVQPKGNCEEQGRVLAPVENGQEPRQSPQLGTKNIHIKQQTVKPSPQLEAKVNQRKQQNVKQSPQPGSVQTETKIHQIKEMPKQDLQFAQSGNVQNGHKPDNNKNQPQLVDSSCQDNSVATSQDLHFAQSGNVQNGHRSDNNMNQLQLVDSSCQDNSVTTSQDLQFAQPGNVQNGHRSDNNMNQPQLVDSSCQDNSVTTSQDLQFAQPGNVQNGHRSDNNMNQPQLVESSCQDNSVATSQDLQFAQYRKVQNEYQPDNNKNQPQLVDSSCKDSSIVTSPDLQSPQFGNVQNQHRSDIKYQPQRVDTSCLDNSGDVTSEQETIITINNVKSCAVYHVLVQVQDQHLEAVIDTAAESTILSDNGGICGT